MEVYGEKPKRFTGAWWDYVWMYYKWHILGTAFAIFMVVTTITQCANRTEYDLKLTVVTENEVVFTQTDIMTEYAQKIIDDATGNGINEVLVTPINVGSESDAEYQSAQMTKLTVEMAVPESYVFIMNRHIADMAIENEILEETSNWAGDSESDGYVISLKGNERIREFGLNPDGEELFIGVVPVFEKNIEKELEIRRHENGVKLARNLVGLE
jgi:hypothetical protein